MNEKEKKAVERIEDTFYSDLGKGINKFQKITLYEDSIRDVRILLNLLEKLQKENEELKRFMAHKNGYTKLLEEDLFENCSNYVIPIQTIKDKIKELNKKEKQELKGTKGQDRYDIKQQYMYQRNILQELLEGRK